MVRYFYFRFVFAVLKYAKLFAYTTIYFSAANNIQSYYIRQRYMRVS